MSETMNDPRLWDAEQEEAHKVTSWAITSQEVCRRRSSRKSSW